MSRTGLCSICEAAGATDQCDRCGGLVCREHLEPELGLCVQCAADARRDVGDSTFQF